MGNCIAIQTKVIKIVKTDGKILEYKRPVRVRQILSNFSGHVLSDKVPAVKYLRHESELIGGRLYYLLPIPFPKPKVGNKKVRFSEDNQEEDAAGTGAGANTGAGAGAGADANAGAVRIKMVITRQELMEMLRNGGVAAKIQEKQSFNGVGKYHDEDDNNDNDDNNNNREWKPLLESIPELD